MDTEPSSKAKKMWNIARIVFYMLRKGLTKSKLMLDFHDLMLKQSKNASKTLTNLKLNHYSYSSTCSCRPDDVNSTFISPRAYEFSCSNSPLIPRRRKHHYYRRPQQIRHHQRDHSYYYNNSYNNNVSHKVFEMYDEYQSVEGSPMIELPGFGRSPTTVRQLRVTDSPFSVKDAEENTNQVDMAAEEFIKKFYEELMEQQKKIRSHSTRYR